MKLSDITVGRYYATTLGSGECIDIILGRTVAIRIDGVERRIRPRDVIGEMKNPEEEK